MENQTKRGCLTPKLESMKLSKVEVRLIPYVHYCNINSAGINEYKITFEERQIIENWISKGYILGDPFTSKFVITRAFFDIMNEVLWEAYANK